MLYLELQHGPSCVGVKQQTVGSDAGAWIIRILNGGLCKNSNFGHCLDILHCACGHPQPCNELLERVLLGYRAVFGRLVQTLCDERGSDAPTWQIVDKRVHQGHAGSIPPGLRRAFTHLGTKGSHA